MSCVQDLSIGELALYANGAGDFAIECRREIARRDSFWDDEHAQHGREPAEATRLSGATSIPDAPTAAAREALRKQRDAATRLSGATLAQRLAEVERERDDARCEVKRLKQYYDEYMLALQQIANILDAPCGTRLAPAAIEAARECKRKLDESLANLSACRQERDHWLTVATQAQGERDAAKAAIATTPRPLPDREAIAASIARGLGLLAAEAPLSAMGTAQPRHLRAADHVLELLRPYALGQPANELDYRVSAEELGDRIARFVENSGPITPWRQLARMVAGVLGVNLRKPDASAHDGEPPAAADLPASLGAPKTWEAPLTPTGELANLRGALEAMECRLFKVEAMAHEPVPVPHADDVELIWTFISRVAELQHAGRFSYVRDVIEAASRAAQLALEHRKARKTSSDR